MTSTERRLAELYSHYIDECFAEDYSGTFVEWLAQSIYGGELIHLCAELYRHAVRDLLSSTRPQ